MREEYESARNHEARGRRGAPREGRENFDERQWRGRAFDDDGFGPRGAMRGYADESRHDESRRFDSGGRQDDMSRRNGEVEGGWDEGHAHAHEHDRDYHQWRQEHVSKLDEDYNEFRNERRKKFADEFEKWRQERAKSAGDAMHGSAAGKK